MNEPRIAIAGGGTGGHIAPALALAEEFASRHGADCVHFLCSGNQLERRMIGHAGFSLTALPVKRPRGTVRSKATTVITTALAVPAARRQLKAMKAEALVCVGGYASLPGALAASMMRIPVFSLEANAVPGKVTRTVSRFARTCFATMPLTRPLDCHVDVSGNPLRRAFRQPPAKQDAKRALGLDPQATSLLIIGGSQGAQALNRAAIASAELLSDRPLQILHITGAADEDDAHRAWRRSGLRHRVAAFTHNMATWMAASDVALTRAGSGTISELLNLSVPMLLVPYPHAADDHQRANALHVVGGEAGILVPEDTLSPERTVELIEQYVLAEGARTQAARNAHALARPEATTHIADSILREISISPDHEDAEESKRAA